jgi:GT2 family glycosyltransferase
MPAPSISVIIVSFNTRELLGQCLRSIAQYCPEAQVVVVDNASRDDSAAMVRSEFPTAELIESETNLGFAGANNRGLAIATADFQVLLNSDTVLEDDTLTRCACWMQANPRLGAASPHLIGVDDQYQSCQFPFLSVRDELAKVFRRPPRSVEGERDPRSWLPGTALMIRREALASVGGRLDEEFFMYGEDADFSMRLRKAGWDLGVFSEGRIRHYGGASGGGSDRRRRPDLEAWNLYARHRWARRHLGLLGAAGVWTIDAFDVGRLLVRGLVHGDLKAQATYARVKAQSLARALTGTQPPKPISQPAIATATMAETASSLDPSAAPPQRLHSD